MGVMKRRLWQQFTLRTMFALTTVTAVGIVLWGLITDRPTRISGLTIMNHSGEKLKSAQVVNSDGTILLDTTGEVNLIHNSGFGRSWPDAGPRIGKRLVVTWTSADGRQHSAPLSILEIKEGADVIIEIGAGGTVTGYQTHQN